jgi:hypothetical protein
MSPTTIIIIIINNSLVVVVVVIIIPSKGNVKRHTQQWQKQQPANAPTVFTYRMHGRE